jgi:hypothetical protein
MGSLEDDVRHFLSRPLPPQDTDAWRDWKAAADSLGPQAGPALLEVLRRGTPDEQYAAVLALRLVGYEAWADGFGRQRSYRVRKIGTVEWTSVVPVYPPPSLTTS